MKRLIILSIFFVIVVTTVFLYSLSNKRVEEERMMFDYETRGRKNPYPFLNFTIDCSLLEDEEQEDCQEFIYNQENVIYPEMKTLTGIDLRWCYDTINYTIYPDESVPTYGSGVDPPRGAFSAGSSSANLKYISGVSIHSRCNMASHELTHAFDNCINMGNLWELTAVVVGGTVEKKLCPGWKIPYNLSKILNHIIPRSAYIEDPLENPNIINMRPYYACLTAQASVIYYGDEEFLRKFYERLLQEPLRLNKEGYIITEAIIYASDEIDENVTIHCLDDYGHPLVIDH